MNILTFTTLYPNSGNPTFALFVENRLRHLLGSYPINSVVIAPVPWMPIAGKYFEKYKQANQTPSQESRHGIKIFHPRFFHLPIIGGWISPLLLALSSYWLIRRLQKEDYKFELIDSHYFFPDGVAAAILSYLLKLPLVITGRGSDINIFPRYYIPRLWIKWAAQKASHIITVSQSLKNELLNLGISKHKITVLRNGVDLDLFKFCPDREIIKNKYNLSDLVFLSVGRLEELKGNDLIIRTLKYFESATLLIIGNGTLRDSLWQLAIDLGVSERVRFMGAISPAELPVYYSVSDVLVLASSREGWPNVLLEAIACGTPVVATDVGGTSEIIRDMDIGVLAKYRTVNSLVEAMQKILQLNPNRKIVRRYAEKFSWSETSKGQFKLFNIIIDKQR